MKRIAICAAIMLIQHSMTAQSFNDITSKYKDPPMMSLLITPITEIKGILERNRISEHIKNVTSHNKTLTEEFVANTLKSFKDFILANYGVSMYASFSYLNLSFKDSVIYYKIITDQTFSIAHAPFTKKQVACLIMFIDSYRIIEPPTSTEILKERELAVKISETRKSIGLDSPVLIDSRKN